MILLFECDNNNQQSDQKVNRNNMKRRISLYNTKSSAYIFSNFLKQYKKALNHYSIGQMLNSKQVLSVLTYMGFVDQQPTHQDAELAKTLTKMLSHSPMCFSVARLNLFTFFTNLCDIDDPHSSQQTSCFEEDASGLAMDDQQYEQPLIIIEIGSFDQSGRWTCTPDEKDQIKKIFGSLRSKRISRSQVEARKKSPKKQAITETFQPKICPKSNALAEEKFKKTIPDKGLRVENRLLQSRESFQSKIKQQLNRSVERQLEQCTFKPAINNHSRSSSKENLQIRSNSQGHLKNLLDKGNAYKMRREKLQELHIKLNESSELEKCTFQPQTTKHSQSPKWVYVRNRDKEIERLREGRKQRQFINQVKDRGYPSGVNWSTYINKKSELQQSVKSPILCIDLKIMSEQYNINVYDGENILTIAERIGREHKIPEKMWWKVEDLIRKAIEQCSDIRVENNRIYAQA